MAFVHFCATGVHEARAVSLGAPAVVPENGRNFRIDRTGGKGSHLKVYVNGAQTIVKHGEIGPILKQAMLKQLGLPKDAF